MNEERQEDISPEDANRLLKKRWSRLTGDDIDAIRRKPDHLRQALKDRYGLSETDATKQVNQFWTSGVGAAFRGGQ